MYFAGCNSKLGEGSFGAMSIPAYPILMSLTCKAVYWCILAVQIAKSVNQHGPKTASIAMMQQQWIVGQDSVRIDAVCRLGRSISKQAKAFTR